MAEDLFSLLSLSLQYYIFLSASLDKVIAGSFIRSDIDANAENQCFLAHFTRPDIPF
jgi:hypothetical protein